VTDILVPVRDMKAAATDKDLREAVRVGMGAGGGRKDTKNKEKETVTYVTKTFPGTGAPQSQFNGQLCTCCTCNSVLLVLIPCVPYKRCNFNFCKKDFGKCRPILIISFVVAFRDELWRYLE